MTVRLGLTEDQYKKLQQIEARWNYPVRKLIVLLATKNLR